MSVGSGIIGTGRHADLALAPAISTLEAAGRLAGVVSSIVERREPLAAGIDAARHGSLVRPHYRPLRG